MDEHFDGYVSLEIFLGYGLYTGTDLDDFLINEKEAEGYACLDAYSVSGKIAKLPGRTGSGDIGLSAVLAVRNPAEPESVNLLAKDLLRYFDKKILPSLAAKRVCQPFCTASIPVDIEFKDAHQNTVLLLSLDADEEDFTGLIPKLEALCVRARQNCLNEMSVYRDDKGRWKITGSADEKEEPEEKED